MTDYRTLASIEVPMSDEAAERLVTLHLAIVNGEVDKDALLKLDLFDGEAAEDVQAEAENVMVQRTDNGLWFTQEDGLSFSNEYAATLISWHLSLEDPKGVVSWTYADTASRPVADAYGGGSVLVTANGYEVIDAGEAMKSALARLAAGDKAAELADALCTDLGLDSPEDLREALDLDDVVHEALSAEAADINSKDVTGVLAEMLARGMTEEDIRAVAGLGSDGPAI